MLNSIRLDPSCPECGATIPLTSEEARHSPTKRCPNGHSVQIKGSDFDDSLKGVEKSLRSFGRS